jgi:hypothetical protein
MANQNVLIETRSLPALTRSSLVTLPSMSRVPHAPLKLARLPACSLLPLSLMPVRLGPFYLVRPLRSILSFYFLLSSGEHDGLRLLCSKSMFSPLPMQQPARERSRGDASDIDGPSREAEWSFGKSDIEGKVARVVARKRGRDRVSNKRERLSQNLRSSTTHRSCPR